MSKLLVHSDQGSQYTSKEFTEFCEELGITQSMSKAGYPLLTNEECANAVDMGEFYRVPCDKRDLNYDKYFKDGDVERNTLTEFDSNNTELLSVEQVKEKLLTLQYIRDELAEWENR